MHKIIEVGGRIEQGVDYQINDESRFYYGPNSVDLVISLHNIYRDELKNFKKGTVQFGLVDFRGSIFILYKFGTELWGDAPFNIFLNEIRDRRLSEEYKVGARYGVAITVQDTFSKTIRAIRYVTFSPEFSSALHQAITKQLALGITADEHDRNISTVNTSFPTPKDLLRMASITCIAGK